MKRHLTKITFYLAHFFILVIIFVLLQTLFLKLSVFIHIQDWQLMALQVLSDRALYALAIVIPGWIFFYWIFPLILMPTKRSGNRLIVLFSPQLYFTKNQEVYPKELTANHKKDSRQSPKNFQDKPLYQNKKGHSQKSNIQIAILAGSLFGLILFAILFLTVYFLEPGIDQQRSSGLALALKKDFFLFLIHVLATGILTPVLEEFFYRVCLSGYILQTYNFLVLKNKNLFHNLKLHGILKHDFITLFFVFACNLFFASVHSQIKLTMFAIGSVFTYLYLRWGLLSSIVAHSVYNNLILFTGTYIQE